VQATPSSSGGCGRLVLIALAIVTGSFALLGVAIAAFYLEENARGDAAWNKTRREIEAKGVSLNRTDYLPKFPPPGQNFGALSIFALEPDPAGKDSSLKAAALKNALDPILSRLRRTAQAQTSSPGPLPFLGKWDQSPRPRLEEIRAGLKEAFRSVHPGASPPEDASATDLLREICPALGELRDENPHRPYCIFPMRFEVHPPADFSFEPISALMGLSRALTYDERVALYEGNGELALDDLAVGRKVMQGLRAEPLMISGLIAVFFEEEQSAVIQQGLADHNWTDAQLQELDRGLGALDMIDAARFWITGELVVYGRPLGDYYEHHRWASDDIFRAWQNRPFDFDYKPPFLTKLSFYLEPRGWLELDRASGDGYWLRDVASLFDSRRQYVDSGRFDALTEAIGQGRSWSFWSLPAIDTKGLMIGEVKDLAMAQVRIDEARIACRLERYRLAHGAFPGSLAALNDPALPHDVMDGNPYHYQRQADGSYLLYSVAWNQIDDHDDHLFQPGQSRIDALDWSWPSGYPKAK